MYLMLIVVNLMMILIIFGYPFVLMVRTPYFFPTIPALPMVGMGVFIVTLALRSAYGLLMRLRNPFSWTVDRIRVDSLLASLDRSIFVHMRSMFNPSVKPYPEVSSVTASTVSDEQSEPSSSSEESDQESIRRQSIAEQKKRHQEFLLPSISLRDY